MVLLIPAYKPSEGLPELVQSVLKIRDSPFTSVLVVDDGSGPEFSSIFRRLESLPAVCVVRHAVNLGKGAALKTGFNTALVRWPEAAGVVTADADGQHAPADIVSVARELARDPDSLVLGVRGFSGAVPLRSRFGNALTRGIFGVITGKQILDTQTGLRGWPRPICMSALRIPLNGYEFELECLVHAPNKVREVTIETIYIDENKSSHFNPILDSMRIYFVFLRYCGSAMVAAVADSAVFYALTTAGYGTAAAQIAGRAVAVVLAFGLARSVVFRSEARLSVSLAKYLALVSVMGFVSFVMLQALHERLGLPVLAAKLIAEGLLFLGNFAIQRDFIFVRRQ